MCAQLLIHVRLFVLPWTVVHEALLSMELSRQEYWSGLNFLFQGSSYHRDQTCISCISCLGRHILH